MDVSNIFKSHRVRANKTQKDVANILGISVKAFHYKENDPEKFSLKELFTLKELYTLNSLDTLIFGYEVHVNTH